MRQVGRLDAGARVGDGDPRPGPLHAECQEHRAPLRRVAEGVLHEIADHLVYAVRIQGHRRDRAQVRLQPDPGKVGPAPVGLHAPPKVPRQVHLLQAQLELPGLEP